MARCLFLMCLLSASFGFGNAECQGAECPRQDSATFLQVSTSMAGAASCFGEQNCRTKAEAAGLQLGGGGHSFTGDYSATGCYSYSSGTYKGMAFYGYADGGGDVESESELTAVTSPKYRVPGTFNCQAAGAFTKILDGKSCANSYKLDQVGSMTLQECYHHCLTKRVSGTACSHFTWFKGVACRTFSKCPDTGRYTTTTQPSATYVTMEYATQATQIGPNRIKAAHGKCLDASQRNTNGGKVHMWSCSTNNQNQQWTYTASAKQIKATHGKCLDASQRNINGGKVLMWSCSTNNQNQQWTYTASAKQIKATHGKCLDASQRNTNGGKVLMWSCSTNNQNQQWEISAQVDMYNDNNQTIYDCSGSDCAKFMSNCCNKFVDFRNLIEAKIKNEGWNRALGLKDVEQIIKQDRGLQHCKNTNSGAYWWWLSTWANSQWCVQGKCATFKGELDQCSGSGGSVHEGQSGKVGLVEVSSEAGDHDKEGDHDQGLEEALSGKRTC